MKTPLKSGIPSSRAYVDSSKFVNVLSGSSRGNKLGEIITTEYGVTQGRKPSLTIFSFYVSDMVKSLDNITTYDFMNPFNIAQLADDTAIISETSESLKCKIKKNIIFKEEVPSSKYQEDIILQF